MKMMTRFRLVSMMALTSLAALTPACSDATPPPPTGSSSAPDDAAVWTLKPDQSLQISSTKFSALVTRLGCNNGVTGQVLAPHIRKSESEIIVTFAVAPKEPGPAPCPGNDQIAYEVDLGEPLQGRSLVDGQCLPEGEAANTSFCSPDATRFKP